MGSEGSDFELQEMKEMGLRKDIDGLGSTKKRHGRSK